MPLELLNIYNDASKAAINADVIFSDKVISLNDKVNKGKKLSQFKKFIINVFFLAVCNHKKKPTKLSNLSKIDRE